MHRNGAGTILSAFTYTYNDASVRTSVVEPGPVTTTWGYDDAYRLTSEKRQDSSSILYADTMTYDNVGNRLTLQNASGTTTFTYDNANQLSTSQLNTSITTFSYDSKGNQTVELTGTNRTTNTWDEENRLTKVEFPGTSPVDNVYTFNGDGKRVQIVDSTGTKRPIWDFENVLLETNGSNTTQVIYTLEPMTYGSLVSQRRSGTTTLYLFDALGSTRKIIDNPGASAAVLDSYDYKAYGETYASSGSTTNVFRWVGQLGYYYDVDRLAYYLRARPYSPKLARFLSKDPIGFGGSKWNLFEYVNSMASQFSDPSGLDVTEDDVIACVSGLMTAFVLGTAVGAICAARQFIRLFRTQGKDWNHDKWGHCVATCRAAQNCTSPLAFLGAVSKEFFDCLAPYMDASKADIDADTEGIRCAGVKGFVPVGNLGSLVLAGLCIAETCEACCDRKYNRWGPVRIRRSELVP
ncbi:MAG: RHS repeat-associated core domain-containing protein [Pirellulaceae bacterium]